MADGRETIGERLLRLRTERGLRQADLAGQGVTNAYVSAIEHGRRKPSVRAIRVIARNLGVSAGYLETGEETPGDAFRDVILSELELGIRLGEPPADTDERLRTVLKEAVESGDVYGATRARIALGAAAAHRGDHDEAARRLERALLEPWVRPITHPDAYGTLGHSYTCVGRHNEADALFRQGLKELLGQTPRHPPTIVRFATYLSYVRGDAGDVDGAREAIREAVRFARRCEDLQTRVRLYWSNARLASSVGDYELARASVDRAIALLAASEDTAHLARAHLLAAEISLGDGELDRASTHLDAGARLLPPDASVEDRAFLLVQRAFVAARSGDGATAIDQATAAIELLGDHEDAIIRGRGHWALAEAYMATGAIGAATKAFVHAAELIPADSPHSHKLLAAWQRIVDVVDVQGRGPAGA